MDTAYDGPREIVVRDKDRSIQFTGRCIGFSSSAEPQKSHWIDIYIFKAETGRYIVNYVGRTNHSSEVDLYTTVVSETAAGVVEALYLEDPAGVRYLTKVARRALTDASTRDSDLHSAFYCERV